MDDINARTGIKIRTYRKMNHMTLQQLADAIHKSRATMSKYETGDISMDLDTLYQISLALNVSLEQLIDCPNAKQDLIPDLMIDHSGISPFFKANRLYFYFYDGRYHRLKEAVITIHKNIVDDEGRYDASMSIHSSTENGRSSEVYYTGNVLYSDMLIRFSFVNQYNKLEQDLLYIFNPLELRDYTEGLLCGISSTDLMPCAFKCLVALSPMEDLEELKSHLMLTSKELRRWKKLNMLIVDNLS